MSGASIILALVLAGFLALLIFFWLPEISACLEKATAEETDEEREERVVADLRSAKVDMLCAVLREEDGWVVCPYYAAHPGLSIKIWIANKDYGLDVNDTGSDPGPMRAGGWKLSKKQQKQIWDAFCSRGHNSRQAADDVEEFIERVQKYREARP